MLQVMRAEERALTLKQCDLYSLCELCANEVEPRATLKRIRMRTTWNGEHRFLVQADEYLLHRAVMNLLSNAVKFSPANTEISIEAKRLDGWNMIAINDQGPGIPPAALGRLFQRYERLEEQRSAQVETGIGLGLVFVDTVIRRHGGHVAVQSQEGQGSRFEIWLPEDPRPIQ